MTIRDTLLANVTTSLVGSNISVSTELPWNSGNVPLFTKNMKVCYIDEQSEDVSTVIETMTVDDNVYQPETALTAYISVDAKNQPGGMTEVISNVLNSRNSVSNVFIRECNMETELTEDRITYTFLYRFLSIT